MRPFETLIYEKEGPVAHVSLDRPSVLNAYNVQMRDDFSQALDAVSDDPDVLALLITGQGRGFCAGADLSEFGSAPSQVVARNVRWERDVWGQLINLEKPIVVAAHGYCIGSGLEIALLCDLKFATGDTLFAMPEVRLGMIPAAGGTQTIPRQAGASQALDLLLTGRRFSAQEALRMGLVTRLIPPERLLEEAWETTRRLAMADPTTVSFLKRALRVGGDMPLEESLEMEKRLVTLSYFS